MIPVEYGKDEKEEGEGDNPGKGTDLAMRAKMEAMEAFAKAQRSSDYEGMAHAFKEAYDACVAASDGGESKGGGSPEGILILGKKPS